MWNFTRGWIRTTTTRSKVWRPAIRRPGNTHAVYPIAAVRMQAPPDSVPPPRIAQEATVKATRLSLWEQIVVECRRASGEVPERRNSPAGLSGRLPSCADTSQVEPKCAHNRRREADDETPLSRTACLQSEVFPRMARAFINLCGGAMVIDPFAGSGTALVEATVMGAPSIGVDIDLLSVAIAQAKAQLLSDDGAVAEAIADVLGRLDASDKGKELATKPAGIFQRSASVGSTCPVRLKRKVHFRLLLSSIPLLQQQLLCPTGRGKGRLC